MIQIYTPSNTDYEKNGDQTLFPVSASVHAILNGAWKAEITHTIDAEGRWKYITEEAVIKMPSFNGDQLFRVKTAKKQDSGVTATMEPIFYDSMGDCWLSDVRPTGKNGQDALDIMLAPNSKYSGLSNITRAAAAYYQNMNFMQALNGDIDQSFINRWGGEIMFDNFTVIVNDRVGGDYGIELRYGKNIPRDGMSYEVDTRDVVTRIYPQAYNGYKMTGNGYVDSPLINNYPTVKSVSMTFDNVKMRDDAQEDDEENGVIICDTQEELDAALTQQCETQYDAGIDKPTVTISADMVLLQNTEQYKDIKTLEAVSLGDTIHCINTHLDITTDARVIEIEFDAVRKKVSSVVIGDFQQQYFDGLTDSAQKIDSVINPDGSLMAEKVQGILNGIYTQLRLQSTVAEKVNGHAFIVEDLDEESDLYGAMVWGTQGLQLSTTRTADGRGWDWTTAITAQGIVANAIITGILSDKTGKNYWNLDTGEFRLSAEAFKINDQTVQDYVDGEIDEKIAQIRTLTMQLSNEYTGVPTDANGSGGDYSDAFTDVSLYIGTTDITESDAVQWTTSPSAGVTGTWDEEKHRYNVTYMSADVGAVSITATYSGLAVTKTFTIAKSKQGLTGSQGEDGRVYMLQTDAQVITQGQDDSFTPDPITFYAYYRDGQTAENIPYAGRFVIEETTDGTSYVRRYTSQHDETSRMYSPSGPDVKNARCILYASGGTENALDMQGVAIVRDIDNLTQEEVFNILTNNGASQGIYMQDGKLYINGTYIKGGTIQGQTFRGGSIYITYQNEDGQTVEIFSANENGVGIGPGGGIITYYSGDTFVSINGELRLTSGKMTGYMNGQKALEIDRNIIRFYSWNDSGNYVGSMSSVKRSSDGRVGLGIYCDHGDIFQLGYQDGDQTGISYPVIAIDANDGQTPPWIAGGATGTIFGQNGKGITFKNGILTEWGLNLYTGNVAVGGTTLHFSAGLLTGVN